RSVVGYREHRIAVRRPGNLETHRFSAPVQDRVLQEMLERPDEMLAVADDVESVGLEADLDALAGSGSVRRGSRDRGIDDLRDGIFVLGEAELRGHQLRALQHVDEGVVYLVRR